MFSAQANDMQDVVRVIADTFDLNPSVNIVIGDGGNRRKKLRRLAEYAFVKAINRNGAFLSDNRMGTALCFCSGKNAFSLKELFYELRFATSLPMSKIIQTLRREAYLKKHRYNGVHLYFWFLGVEKGAEKAGFELKDHIFQWSEKEGLPIILETSVERNKAIYERYGFEVYHEWSDPTNNIVLWFMIRNV